MSYPRNAASPPRIAVGAVVQISDGEVQTSGVSVVVRPEGGAESAGGGTVAYGATSGIVYYTPTQAETDYIAFSVVAYKTGCIPVEKTVITSASSVAGYAGVDWSKVNAPTTTLNLSGTTVKTATDVETDTDAIQTDVTTLLGRLTSGRASNLDNLDVAVSVIQSQITALNNLSAKSNWFGSLLLEIPDSGTRDYLFELVVRDDEDKLVNLDGLPTIALVNAAGTDRSSLITTAIANPATGRYTLTITIGTSTVNESLTLTASGTVSGEARYAVIAPQVVDYDSATQINTILTRIGTPAVTVSDDIAALNDLDSTAVQAAAAAALTAYDPPTNAELEARTLLAADYATSTALSALSAVFSGISSLADWIRRIVRKDAGTAGMTTAQTEINTGGTATFSGTADSLEAIRDRGDAAWTTGGGGGSGSGARTVTVTVTDGTDPLQNAVVRMTEGVNTYTATTNVSGVATFNLDDATYTVAISKPSYSYAGTTLAVNSDETATYAMSAVVVPAPSDPALCAVTIPILDQYGVALADEVVEIRFNEFEAGATTTALVLSPPPTLTSDVDGLAEVTLLREASYSVFYGQDDYRRRLDFTVPDAASYTVGE